MEHIQGFCRMSFRRPKLHVLSKTSSISVASNSFDFNAMSHIRFVEQCVILHIACVVCIHHSLHAFCAACMRVCLWIATLFHSLRTINKLNIHICNCCSLSVNTDKKMFLITNQRAAAHHSVMSCFCQIICQHAALQSISTRPDRVIHYIISEAFYEVSLLHLRLLKLNFTVMLHAFWCISYGCHVVSWLDCIICLRNIHRCQICAACQCDVVSDIYVTSWLVSMWRLWRCRCYVMSSVTVTSYFHCAVTEKHALIYNNTIFTIY